MIRATAPFRQDASILALVLMLLLAACGDTQATPTVVAVSATPTVTVGATSTAEQTATTAPSIAPTVTAPALTIAAEGTPGAQLTATEEPDDCFRSVGSVLGWYQAAGDYTSSDLPKHAQSLESECAEDRWLAIWLLGSVRDSAAIGSLQDYIAAHPDGDWLRDEFDLVPLAQAAVAYIAAPPDAERSYTVQNLELHSEPRRVDPSSGDSKKGQNLTAGSEIMLLEEIKTGQTVPDHGGETDVIYRHIRLSGDSADYYIDDSQYVAAYPRYFQRPILEATP